MKSQKRIILKTIYLIVVLLALIKVLKINITNYEDFYLSSKYDLELIKFKKIHWKNIEDNGTYLLTSKDCSYCLKYSGNASEILKNNSNLPSYVIELDFNEYLTDENLNKMLNKYKINSIPCVLIIDRGAVQLIEFEEIKDYEN